MNDDWVILGGAHTPPWDEDLVAGDTSPATGASLKRAARNVKGAQRARERAAESLSTTPPANVAAEVVQAHLECMPGRYWLRTELSDLPLHLSTIHDFLEKLAAPDSSGNPVAVNWREAAGSELIRVVVCSWNRRGLLDQIAAAFNALRICVERADIYTRTDSLVLDVFEVVEPDAVRRGGESRLNDLPFLLEGAFSDPPRFASVWAREFHKVLPKPEKPMFDIRFDNQRSPEHTVLSVRAPDRLGLLYDLVHSLTENRLQIDQALIDTRQGIAKDQFHLTDSDGLKVTRLSRLRQVRKDLVAALTV